MAQAVIKLPHSIDEKEVYSEINEEYVVPSLNVDLTIEPDQNRKRRFSVSAESNANDSDNEDDDDDFDDEEDDLKSNNTNNDKNINNQYSNNKQLNSNSNIKSSTIKSNGVSTNRKTLKNRTKSHFIRKVYPKSESAIQRILASVSDLFLWNGLDNEQQKLLIDAMFEKKVNKNEFIIRQGDRGDYFYVIENGFYEVWKSSNIKKTNYGGYDHISSFELNDQKKVFEYNNKGSFGELALMYNSPRAATVKATKNGILWAVDRKTFRHIIVGSTARKRYRYEKFLNKIKLFKNLNDNNDIISQIADILEQFEFSQNEYILKQGSNECQKFYIIQNGTANVLLNMKDGKQKLVATLKQGDYFGERGLLLNDVRSASIIVTSKKMNCVAMDKASFIRLMDSLNDRFRISMRQYTYSHDFDENQINDYDDDDDDAASDLGSDQDEI